MTTKWTAEEAFAAVLGELVALRGEVEALRKALPPQMGSVAQAAAVLGCSPRTVWRRIRDNEIPYRRVGQRFVIELSALHAEGGR